MYLDKVTGRELTVANETPHHFPVPHRAVPVPTLFSASTFTSPTPEINNPYHRVENASCECERPMWESHPSYYI